MKESEIENICFYLCYFAESPLKDKVESIEKFIKKSFEISTKANWEEIGQYFEEVIMSENSRLQWVLEIINNNIKG